jgi:hypothetical protein
MGSFGSESWAANVFWVEDEGEGEVEVEVAMAMGELLVTL